MKYFLGFIFVLAGAWLLAVNLGFLPMVSWEQLQPFWPVVLIMIGVMILTRRARRAALIQVIVLVLLIAAVVALLPYMKKSQSSQQLPALFRIEQERSNVPQYEINGDPLDLFRAH